MVRAVEPDCIDSGFSAPSASIQEAVLVSAKEAVASIQEAVSVSAKEAVVKSAEMCALLLVVSSRVVASEDWNNSTTSHSKSTSVRS